MCKVINWPRLIHFRISKLEFCPLFAFWAPDPISFLNTVFLFVKTCQSHVCHLKGNRISFPTHVSNMLLLKWFLRKSVIRIFYQTEEVVLISASAMGTSSVSKQILETTWFSKLLFLNIVRHNLLKRHITIHSYELKHFYLR